MKLLHVEAVYKFVHRYNFFLKALFLWALVSILWNISTLTMLSLMERSNLQVCMLDPNISIY